MKHAAILFLLLLALPSAAQRDSLLVMFWNVENFFDWRSGNGPQGWSASRFYRKCNAVAKTVFKVADEFGGMPDAIGFAEVENLHVLRETLFSTNLRKVGYRIVHFESPDHRGIDCALLYRRATLRLLRAQPKHLYDSTGAVIATRDILLAEFEYLRTGDTLALAVNHHPSQIGGKTAGRDAAMGRLGCLLDSLAAAGVSKALAIGDFNQDRWHDGAHGTIRYNGGWEKIDGYFARGFADVRESVFNDASLTVPDKSFGGRKPLRTFSGPRYLGGVSDHLPIVLNVYF